MFICETTSFHYFSPRNSESLKILDIRLREVGAKRPLNGTSKLKKVKKKTFFLRGKFRQFSNNNVHIWDHFFPLLFPKDSESQKILDIRLWGGGPKRPLNGTSKVKKVRKKTFFLRGNFRKFSNKNVHIWDHFFPLLFSKDSKSLKILDIRLREVGAKRPLNGTSKVNTHTHTQTDRQTDISTYRKHRPWGLMLWKIHQKGTDRQTHIATTRPTVPRGRSWWKSSGSGLCIFLWFPAILDPKKSHKINEFLFLIFLCGFMTLSY